MSQVETPQDADKQSANGAANDDMDPAALKQIVRTLRGELNDALSRMTEQGEEFDSPEAQKQWAQTHLLQSLRKENERRLSRNEAPLTQGKQRKLIRYVMDLTYGLGPLEQLLRNEDVTDVHVMGHDHVMLRTRDGRWRKSKRAAAESDQALIALVQRVASRQGGTIERRWDQLNPELNMQLDGGERLFAVRDVVDRPQLVIRKHDDRLNTLDALAEQGMLDEYTKHFLESAVRGRCNIILIGATGSGKTTVLRSMCSLMPPDEHKVTVEEAKEIGLGRDKHHHPLVREMEVKPPNLQGEGGVGAQQLVRMSLRMDPDRIILGEVRGGEALQMLTAMTQGQDGSICTMHGYNAKIAFARLKLYVKFGGLPVPDEDIAALISDAIDFVVFIRKRPNPNGKGYKRVIEEIVEARGVNETNVASNEIARYNPDRDRVEGLTKPSAETISKLTAGGFNFKYWRQCLRSD